MLLMAVTFCSTLNGRGGGLKFYMHKRFVRSSPVFNNLLNSSSNFNHCCLTREKVKAVHCNKVAQLKMSTVSARVPASLLLLACSLSEFTLNKKGWNTYGCRSINSPHNLLISPYDWTISFSITPHGNNYSAQAKGRGLSLKSSMVCLFLCLLLLLLFLLLLLLLFFSRCYKYWHSWGADWSKVVNLETFMGSRALKTDHVVSFQNEWNFQNYY